MDRQYYCQMPGCNRPVYVDPVRGALDYCGRSHADDHRRLLQTQALAQAQAHSSHRHHHHQRPSSADHHRAPTHAPSERAHSRDDTRLAYPTGPTPVANPYASAYPATQPLAPQPLPPPPPQQQQQPQQQQPQQQQQQQQQQVPQTQQPKPVTASIYPSAPSTDPMPAISGAMRPMPPVTASVHPLAPQQYTTDAQAQALLAQQQIAAMTLGQPTQPPVPPPVAAPYPQPVAAPYPQPHMATYPTTTTYAAAPQPPPVAMASQHPPMLSQQPQPVHSSLDDLPSAYSSFVPVAELTHNQQAQQHAAAVAAEQYARQEAVVAPGSYYSAPLRTPISSSNGDVARIYFYNRDEPFFEFTNFFERPLEVDGRVYPTSEHLFQASKFHDFHSQELVRTQPTPRDAFEVARSLPGLREDWDTYRDTAMFNAVRHKFIKNKDLLRLLLSTGHAQLVEHTRNDSYWGDGGDGSGQNRLGQLLMTLRSQMQEQLRRIAAERESGARH